MTMILCSIPNPADATSLYRAVGPLETLRRKAGVLLVVNPDHVAWPVLKSVDMAFFQRPMQDGHVKSMKLCKANHKPIWVDYDDNLHAVPPCNRRYPMYGQPGIQHNIACMIAMADVVTVTTPYLASCFQKILKCFPNGPELNTDPAKIKVIPNAWDFEIHGPIERTPRSKLIMWRGSDSHCKDLWLHTTALTNIIRDHQDWNYEFVGEPFWLTIEELKKVARPTSLNVTASMDPVHFYRHIKTRAPRLMIVPLEDQAFNRSKSNIAWLEATVAGSVTIAPDWDEWRRPGVITYDGYDDFEAKMRKFMAGEYDEDKLWAESRDYIRDHLPLAKVNRAREEIIRSLVNIL